MPLDSTSSVVPLARPRPLDAEAALLDLLGPVDGLHVLVIGSGCLGPMLALHRRGAAGVTTATAGSCVHAEPADAALAPRLSTPESADAAIAYARRAIRPLNNLVIGIAPDAPPALLPYVRQRLATHGFRIGRTLSIGSGAAIVADLPLYGRLKCA